MSQRFSYFFVLLAAMLWGTAGTAQTFMPQTIHPLVVGASRLTIGGFSLLIVLIVMRKINIRNWPWKATIYAALSMAAFQYFFFTSIRLTGVAIGTVVAIGSAPAFSGLVEWVVLKRRPSKVWLAATGLAIIGCLLLFSNKVEAVVNSLGILMSLGAGLMFAFYALYNKDVLESTEAIPAVAVIFSMSAIFLMPFLFVFETAGMMTTNGMLTVLYLGFATTSIAYVLFAAGLKMIPSSSAVTLSLAEPLTAAMLGVLVVGERLTLPSWIGVFLLLGGILVLTLGGKKDKQVAL